MIAFFVIRLPRRHSGLSIRENVVARYPIALTGSVTAHLSAVKVRAQNQLGISLAEIGSVFGSGDVQQAFAEALAL